MPGTAGSGSSRTPLQYLDGIITPSRLHFERHHSGVPEIDPDNHKLVIHGLVDRPLAFDLDALERYPKVSRIQFLECSGNSFPLLMPEPMQSDCAALHGLVSCSEWGGVPLNVLLDEAGVKPDAKWVVAEGADSAAMNRSVPLSKIMDDAIVALYQNGERLRPANGYPMRLFLPGWEGNASVKWLRALHITDQPAMSKEETSKYTDLQDDGSVHQFTFTMGVKSTITSPSPGLSLHEHGPYQISGLAWSGAGRIARVEVSADGGQSWAKAGEDDELFDGPPDDYGCKGAILRLPFDDRDILLFSGPGRRDKRDDITVQVSFDRGESWPVKRIVKTGPGNYTWMAAGRKGTPSENMIYLLSNKDWMARFNLAWLLEKQNQAANKNE